jgi:hypothetical protein
VDALVALAEVLYPSGTTGIPNFVETYVLGRLAERAAHRDVIGDARE